MPYGRFLHTMIHVADMERSIDFYTRVMGMSLLRQGNMPAEGRSNAFLSYAPEADGAAIELTAYSGRSSYEKGNGFGHLALEFADVTAACADIVGAGGTVTKPPFVIANGKTIAFVVDPDGYEIEMVQPAA
jgi:lactoylglutathione lyase